MNVFNEENLQGIRVSSIVKPDNELLVFYEGSITPTFMQYLASELNQFDPETINGFSLMLTSPGGDIAFLKCFAKFAKDLGLNSIYAVGQTSSAALAIMLECRKHRIPVYIDEFCHVV
jgi:hypothetical protein